MRLPVRHPAPDGDAPALRCHHLDALADALVGVPLRAASELVAGPGSRGRYGSGLQWQLGLSPHDASEEPDWEGRIEIKLVTVWKRRGTVVCDKVKVCDAHLDPRRKLANVLWVFADRLTRTVVGSVSFVLAGEVRRRLAERWHEDPHFSRAPIFVESREQDGRSAPAYYLSAEWFAHEGLLPDGAGIFDLDSTWWSNCRRQTGRDPVAVLVDASDGSGRATCPQCGGRLRFETEPWRLHGWAPALHELPLSHPCGARGHCVVDAARLVPCRALSPPERQRAALGVGVPARVWRAADHVLEPEDHGH